MIVALGSCDAAPPSATVPIMVTAESDAAAVDPAQAARCAALDECACAQDPGCVPLTTDCWCPPTACGATASCTCEGGRFLGCNPAGAGCSTSHCALLAEPSLPDGQGCIGCADPTDCAGATTRLAATCPEIPAPTVDAICGGTIEDCSTFCLGALRTCGSALCALCLDCDCSNDLFVSCVRECLSSAQNRH
jgi:hypothetical protein